MKQISRKILILLVTAFTFGSSIILAEHVPDTIRIDAVSITRRRPLTMVAIRETRIDTLSLADHLDNSLSDLLSKHSPVFIKSYGQGSLATASFRGTSASHTQVEWNNIPINNPMLGQTDLSLIPVFFVDEVSLLHGSSSMIQSTGALGGSIHLGNVPKWESRINGSLLQTVGSFGTFQTFVTIGGGVPDLQFKLRIAHDQSENNFRYFNNANGEWNYERMKDASYTIDGLMGEVNYRRGDHTLSAHVWLQGADRNLPAIMSYDGPGREEYQNDAQVRASVEWIYYGNRMKNYLTSGYSKSGLDYFLANSTDGGYLVNYNSFSSTHSSINNYVAEAALSASTILRGTINYNYHLVDIMDETTLQGFDASRSETGAGVSIHHLFTKRFSAFAIIRGALIDRVLSPVMPSLGLELLPFQQNTLSIKMNMGRNYHQPTMNDLYWIPGGNPDLHPEEGYSADLTFDYTLSIDSTLSFQSILSGYLTRVNNWIIWQPGEYRYWQAENIKDVFARGLEYSIISKYHTGPFKFDLTGHYALTRTTNEASGSIANDYEISDAGKQLIYIPVHSGSGSLYLSYKKLMASYGISYTGERYTTSGNEDTRHSLPGFSLHNLSAGRVFSLWKIEGEAMLKIENLFNKDYQAILWRAMPGRSYTVMLKLDF